MVISASTAVCSFSKKSPDKSAPIQLHEIWSPCNRRLLFILLPFKILSYTLLKFMRLYGQIHPHSPVCKFCCRKGQRPVSLQSDASQPFSIIGQYNREVLPVKASQSLSYTSSCTYLIMFMLTFHFFQDIHLLAWTEVKMSRSWSSKLIFCHFSEFSQRFHVLSKIYAIALY